MLLTKHKFQNFIFGLLVCVLVIDPTNTLLGLKEFVFILFIGSCIAYRFQIEKNSLLFIVVFFFITIISLLFGLLQGFQFNNSEILAFIKSLFFLFILLFVRKFDFIPPLTKASLVIAIITIIVAIIFLLRLPFATKLYLFFYDHANFIMVNEKRYFLGYWAPNFFYKTSPILVIPFAFSFYKALDTKRKQYYLISMIFFLSLMLSGTRANLFSTVLILGLIFLNQIYKNYFWKPIALFILQFFFAAAIIITFMLLKEVEYSNQVKFGHIDSIIDLFRYHPLVLLVGQGPGSLYYSSGFKGMTHISELTYLEIIRMFGLIGGGIILFIFLLPLIIAYRSKKQLKNYFPFSISYLAYLFIGGTNPLLLGSTGYLVLATAYSFVLRKENYVVKN